MRDVLVHYHLFKNAGSSIDLGLERSFGDAWHAFEPPDAFGIVTATQLDEVIAAHPDAVAFSSHCIVPPLSSRVARVHPIVVLREPIARVASAWLFEWQKQPGLDAPSGPLADYIREKFSVPRSNAIEDFQTLRLSVQAPDARRPANGRADADILADARAFIDALPVFGLVERFAESATRFERVYGDAFPALAFEHGAENVTQDPNLSTARRHARVRDEIGDELFAELVLRNQLDIQLYAYALGRFEAQSGEAVTSAALAA